MKGTGRVQRAPHFRFVGPAHLDDHQFIGIGQRLVHFHAQHAGNAAFIAQMDQHESVVADFSNDRRFTRRQLASHDV